MALKNIKSKGFTIVELLVVIVVIGILATITFVSYGSVTAKANTAKGQSMATSIVDRANMFTIQGASGTWPRTLAGADGAATSTAVSASVITGYTFAAAAIASAPATTTTTVNYQLCGTTSSTSSTLAPANIGAITNPTGVLVGYWDYSAPGQATIGAGNTAAGSVGPYRVGDTVYNNLVACFYAAS